MRSEMLSPPHRRMNAESARNLRFLAQIQARLSEAVKGHDNGDGKNPEIPIDMTSQLRLVLTHPLLERHDERKLLLISQKDKEVPNREKAVGLLVRHNLKFIFGIAKKFHRKFSAQYGKKFRLTDMDLFNAGFEGFHMGITRFDIQKPYRLGTYAKDWVKHYIQKTIAENGFAARSDFRLLFSRDSRGSRMGPRRQQIIRQHDAIALNPVHLEDPLNNNNGYDGDDLTIADTVPDTAAGLEEEALLEELTTAVWDEVKSLPPDEADVVMKKYLLPLTPEEIRAKHARKKNMGTVGRERLAIRTNDEIGRTKKGRGGKTMTWERVRQILKNALQELRKNPTLLEHY